MIFFLSLVLALSRAQRDLEPFSRLLLDKFEHQSRAALVEEEIVSLRSQLRTKPESGTTALRTAKTSLERLFSDRVAALRKLTSAAENAAQEYIHDTPDAEFRLPLDEYTCLKETTRINESDVRQTPLGYDGNLASGVHVNIESYRCDPTVRRDFGWTGSDVVEKTMKANKEASPEMKHQYIGTYSGLTRMYPRRRWETEPSQITIDLFDPKFRPWFVNAESLPKDIVFLIDYSGSVKGPTMHLIKIAMMYILSTLNPNDHFYGVYFSSSFGPILECHNNTFLPATTVNKRIFFEKLAEIEEKDQAHISAPFNFSLDVLRENLKSNSSLFSYSRSGGHKLLMLFTDGVDDWTTSMLDEEIQMRGDDPIRIFGYSMGYGTGPLPILQWLACNTFASDAVIDSFMDVKPQSRVFLDNLSRVMARSMEGVPVEDRQVSWTNLYMEAQGNGPTVTASLPVLTKQGEIVWTGQGLAGVAAVDIGIDELTKDFPSGEQIYAFIVDRNGVLLYHPRLVLPKTEIHCVRRSACYDASQVKAKAGSGLRVQYGFSDQRVYRLVGLIDSIPTIDMFELEGNSTEMNELRRQIIDGKCDERVFLDKEREVSCASIEGTPFSVVIVNSNIRETIVAAEEKNDISVARNPLVSYFLSKRSICNWALDRIDANLRFAAMQGLSDCEELSTTKTFVSAAHKWAESWPTAENMNTSCEEMQLPAGFEPRHFVSSFVYTRPQILTHFPSCSSIVSMKALTAKFDEERLSRDPVTQLQVSVRNDVVIAYKAFNDENGNRLAVVGTQWRMDYLDGVFRNWTNSSSLWNPRCKKKDCLLVTKSGFVIASTTRRRPNHLASFDPQLFASLDQNKLVTITSWVDAQAECQAKKTAPWSSASSAPRSPLRSLVNGVVTLLGKAFWIDFYYSILSKAFAQPEMSGGICRFQKIKPVERCFLKYWQYTMQLNITKQMQLVDLKCSRFARVFPVPGTMLTLIEADRSCPGYRSKKSYPIEAQKLEMCQKVNLFSRHQPNYQTDNSSLFNFDDVRCDKPKAAHTLRLSSIIFVLLWTTIYGL